MHWKPYGSGSQSEVLFLGKWKVASIGWGRSSRDQNPYGCYYHLPGLVQNGKKRFDTIEEAKRHVENVVTAWVINAELKNIAQ